jgi:hypothetical protein
MKRIENIYATNISEYNTKTANYLQKNTSLEIPNLKSQIYHRIKTYKFQVLKFIY